MSKQNSMNDNTVLVLGANGKTGSRVFQRLNDMQWPVRAGSRSVSPKFDWENPGTWEAALKDIRSVYVSYHPDLALPGTVAIIKEFTATAIKSGIKNIVLLSGRGEPEAQACEKIVMASGIDWTIIRSGWFFQNFSEGNFLEPILAGHVALPAGDIAEPFIDIDDIAEIAVAALTTNDHAGKLYEVTGPRSLTFKEVIEAIATATGKPIQYQRISMDAYAGMMKEYDVPEELIGLITYLFTEVLDGRNATPANGVKEALGREPGDISAYIKKAIAANTWQTNAVTA